MNVLDLVRRNGIELKRVASTHGGEYAGPCPGCGGRDRFRVWREENSGEGSYWCRQCGRGGDAIQFLRDFEGLTFREACGFLKKSIPDSRDLRYRSPRERQEKAWEPRTCSEPEATWQKHAKKFALWCYDQLHENTDALGFLEARGIREETALSFYLGWNAGDGKGKDSYRDREAWGLSQVKNEKGRKRPLWLPRGWTVPLVCAGELKRIRIRRAEPLGFGPRYYVVPGSSMEMMVLEGQERTAGYIWTVVETELDAILIHQEAAKLCGVIALGSAGAKPNGRAAEALKDAAHILVALDCDAAGAQYWPWWQRMFPRSVRWPVPEGKDPGEAWQRGVNIKEWIIAGLPAGLRG